MRFLILAVFCYGVKGEVLRPGLGVSYDINIMRQAIGPIEKNGSSVSKEKASKFIREHCNGLNDNEEDVTNEENLVFPCVDNEIECVREFLVDNSNCTPVFGPVPDPLCIAQNTVYLLSSNITMTYSDLEVRGLSDAKVKTFYYNKKTGFVILSILLENLTVSTPGKHFEYKRAGYESIDISDCTTITYRNVIFTAEIPGLHCGNLFLFLSDMHVYVGDSNLDFNVGPNIYNSTNPTAMAGNAALSKNLPIVAREILLFQSQVFMASYIQSKLCYFRLELFSI